MTLKAFFPDSIVTNGQLFAGKALVAEGARVMALADKNDVPASAERIPLPGLTLAPGLVDAQVNGGGGDLFNDNPDKLEKIADAHRKNGTAAFLATLISDDIKKIPAAVAGIKKYRQQNPDGAVAGLHLEGPFLNPERKGIHPAKAITVANRDVLQSITPADVGTLMITLAPEVFDTAEIAGLAKKGAILSAGHSAVDAGTLASAVQAGLRGVTHLYNGMGGLSARAPGLSGLALTTDALWCSLICDDAHVDAAMIQLALRAKPPGKLFLVSDAMPPAGQSPQTGFNLLGQNIHAKNGKCVDDQNNLAGSALTLFECVKIAVQKVGIALPQALAMASQYPAEFLKIDRDFGSFAKGKRSDFIAFDSNLKLEKVS